MKETKTLLLEDEEVDNYNDLINKFDKCVEKGIEEELSRKNTTRYFFIALAFWIVTLIGFNRWL